MIIKPYLIILLFTAFFLVSCSKNEQEKNKSIYFTNSYATLYALRSIDGEELWQFKPNSGGFVWSPIVTKDGIYYVVGDKVYAVDHHGQARWVYDMEQKISRHILYENGIVYVKNYYDSKGLIHAINAETGTIENVFEVPFDGDPNWIINNHVIYLANVSQNLYAIDPIDGKTIWEYPTNSISLELFTDNNKLYFSIDNSLYAVNMDNGALAWNKSFSTDAIINPKSIVINNGRVYFLSALENILYTIDANSGNEIRDRIHLKLPYVYKRPFIVNNMIFLGHGEGISAVNLDSGEEVWSFESTSYYSSDPVVDGNIIYFPGSYSIDALDASTGQELWHFEVSGDEVSTPFVY